MGEAVPQDDHVVRLCKGSECDAGVPGPTAFMLRPTDTDGALSVNWLEHFGDIGRDAQVAGVRQAKSHMNIRAAHKFAVLNVAIAIDAVKAGTPNTRELRVLQDPITEGEHPDPSHAGVYDLPLPDDGLIEAELLASAVIEVHPGKL